MTSIGAFSGLTELLVVMIGKGRVKVRELKTAEPRFISQIYAGCRLFGSVGNQWYSAKWVRWSGQKGTRWLRDVMVEDLIAGASTQRFAKAR